MSGTPSYDDERQLEANRLIVASLLADRRTLLAETIRQRVLTAIPHGVREVSFHVDDDALILDDATGAPLEHIDEVVLPLSDDLVRISPEGVFAAWGTDHDAAGRLIVSIPAAATSP